MAIHRLKTWPCYFVEVISGRKNFEVRKNDRGFKTGDLLDLIEWDPDTGDFTGRQCRREVTYILDNSNPFVALGDMVIMSIR